MNTRPKFYTLEDMTQEDLNKLALERNTFAEEIQRLNEDIETYRIQSNYFINRSDDLEEEVDRLNNIMSKIKIFLMNRIKSAPETMAEVYEDEFILNQINEMEEGK